MSPKNIVIAGGGTAGWMTASLMQHNWPESQITLIESSKIGTIGVGEGSTPGLRNFFKKLNIAENEWMPYCNATYKSGIEFINWSEKLGYERYFHPFFSSLDNDTGNLFFDLANQQKAGFPNNAHPDNFFVSKAIVDLGKAPKFKTSNQNINIDYGYHFDAGLLAKFLKNRCINLGLNHIIDEIIDINLADTGDIESLTIQTHGDIQGELFVDCTGFQSLLAQQTLSSKFESFEDNLFNDSAVAIQTPLKNNQVIQACTKSTALSNGWAWEIPLTNRNGNGYVYSSKFLTPSQAEQELRSFLGIGDADVKVKHLKMKVGRIDKHWNKNCIAIGLSQGFIEPLEATALMIVQYSIETFIDLYCEGESQASAQINYNNLINNMFERVRDYIVTHYKTNSRTDSPYWSECREIAEMSSELNEILQSWRHINPEVFERTITEMSDRLAYFAPSWYVILAGMGQFPERGLTKNPAIKHPIRAQEHLSNLANQLFVDQKAFLNQQKTN